MMVDHQPHVTLCAGNSSVLSPQAAALAAAAASLHQQSTVTNGINSYPSYSTFLNAAFPFSNKIQSTPSMEHPDLTSNNLSSTFPYFAPPYSTLLAEPLQQQQQSNSQGHSYPNLLQPQSYQTSTSNNSNYHTQSLQVVHSATTTPATLPCATAASSSSNKSKTAKDPHCHARSSGNPVLHPSDPISHSIGSNFMEQQLPCTKVKARRNTQQSSLAVSRPQLFSCSECSRSFFTNHSLRMHLNLKHKRDMKSTSTTAGVCMTVGLEEVLNDVVRYASPSCKTNSFLPVSNIRDATSSMTTDSKGRIQVYQCEVCERSFTFACRLASHMRCHVNDRPFSCSTCGQAFTQRGYLLRHAAVHSQDRPFTCPECQRTYKHYGSLVNHRKVHCRQARLNLTTQHLPESSEEDSDLLKSLQLTVTSHKVI